MDKKTSEHLPISNAADYIDALNRPKSKALIPRNRLTPGRRMRDKYRNEAVLTQVVKRLG